MQQQLMAATPIVPTHRVAPDTYVVPQLNQTPVGYTFLNSLVITGEQPVIVDTGAAAFREQWLEQVFGLVEPEDVRYVFLSHDDIDHTGNLLPVLELCPNAELVTNWFTVERMSAAHRLPLDRLRWVNDGDSFDAGDRTLVAIRPPYYDSPTTRGLYDAKTGVYWASDCFAAPVPFPVEDGADVPDEAYRGGFLAANRLIAPWFQDVDPAKMNAKIDRLQALGPRTIASGHGPTIHGRTIEKAYALLRDLPALDAFQEPTQAQLEQMRAAMMAA